MKMTLTALIFTVKAVAASAGVPCTLPSDYKDKQNLMVCGDNRLEVYAPAKTKVTTLSILVADHKNGTEQVITVHNPGLTRGTLKAGFQKAKSVQAEIKKLKSLSQKVEYSIYTFELENSAKYYSDANQKKVVKNDQFVVQRNVASGPPQVGGVRGH